VSVSEVVPYALWDLYAATSVYWWLTPKFSCSRINKGERSEQSFARLTAATHVSEQARESYVLGTAAGGGISGLKPMMLVLKNNVWPQLVQATPIWGMP